MIRTAKPYSYQPGKAGQELHCEQVALSEIARRTGTPAYIYSGSNIVFRYLELDRALKGYPHQVCFAVKANSNLGVLALLAKQGAGFDIVSGGELYRVLQAGGDPRKTVFSGVGKSAEEMDYALAEGVHIFNCESEGELRLLDARARKAGRKVLAGIRVNPQVDARTHPYISTGLREHKFGIPIREAEKLYLQAKSLPGLRLEGVSCHIGSQITEMGAFSEALTKVVALVGRLRKQGCTIRQLDAGGGVAVAYQSGDVSPSFASYARTILRCVRGTGLKLYVEPGRSLVAESGVLLTRVLHIKADGRKRFIIVDAAMNDLIRPSLYGAYHEIRLVNGEKARGKKEIVVADVVGPVCESGDFLARGCSMPLPQVGDLLAVETAGAYGFVMSSNYNSRPRAAEVLVRRDKWKVVRKREQLADLIRGESGV
jgi:diaminopimelate decarboxylase